MAVDQLLLITYHGAGLVACGGALALNAQGEGPMPWAMERAPALHHGLVGPTRLPLIQAYHRAGRSHGQS